MTDTTAEEVRSLFQKLKDEHPGDFITVAEIRNAVLDEAAEIVDAKRLEIMKSYSWSDMETACQNAQINALEEISGSIRSLKSGAKT